MLSEKYKKPIPVRPNRSNEARYRLYLLGLIVLINRVIKSNILDVPSYSLVEIIDVFDRLRRAVISESELTMKANEMVGIINKGAVQANEDAGIVFRAKTQEADLLSAAVSENVNLIRGLSTQYIDRMQSAIMASRNGTLEGSLADVLSEISGITKNRAKLIARDQANKIHGTVTKIRSQTMGSVGYQWRNQRDERVRGNPSGMYPNVSSEKNHWIREGQYFLWQSSANPPAAPDGYPFRQPPEDGFPGYAVNCRCFAAPVFTI